MSQTRPGCPSGEAIEAYASGAAGDPEIGEHVARCPECASRVEAARFARRFGDVMAGAEDPPPASGERTPSAPGYRVIREVACGGQGVVYEAEQTATGQRVAIKSLPAPSGLAGASAGARARFAREVQISASLNHPGIVRLLDRVRLEDGRDALVMELVEGEALDRWLDRRRPMAEADLLELLARIADALGHAHHRGVIHRDLKPSNILVDDHGRPHLLDFGIARRADEDDAADRVTRTGEFTGTLAYAAPEQVTAEHAPPDVRTDVYALGVIGCRALTGRPPYAVEGSLDSVIRNILDASPPARSSAGVGIDPWTVVTKAMAKSPARRYQSALEMAEDLRRAARGLAIEARGDSRWYVLRKSAGRHRFALTVAAAILAGLLAVLATLAVGNTRLTGALRESRLLQLRANVAAGSRDRAERVLWSEMEGAVPAGVDAPTALWGGSLRERELLWAFVEMQARAACIAVDRGGARGVVAMREHEGGTIGLVGSGGWSGRVALQGGAPAIERRAPMPEGTSIAWLTPTGDHALVYVGGMLRCVDTERGSEVSRWGPDGGFGIPPGVSVTDWGAAVSGSDGVITVLSAPDLTPIFVAQHAAARQVPWLDREARLVSFVGTDGLLRTADIEAGRTEILPGESILAGAPSIDSPQVLIDRERSVAIVAHAGGLRIAPLAGGGGPSGERLLLKPGYRLSASLSQDGSVLAARAFGDSTLHLWSAGAWEPMPGLPGHHGAVELQAFAAGGSRIVTTDARGDLRVWATPGRFWRTRLSEPTSRAHQLAVDPDGRTVLATDDDGRLLELDVGAGGATVRREPSDPANGPVRVAVSSDGVWVATASLTDRVELAHGASDPGSPRTVRLGPDARIVALGFMPGRTRPATLMVCLEGGSVRLIDAERGEIVRAADVGGGSALSDARWSPTGELVAAAFRDGSVTLVDAGTLGEVWTIRPFEAQVRCLSFSPDGTAIVAAGDAGRLISIDARTGRFRVSQRISEDSLFAVAHHPAGRTVAVGDRAGRVICLDGQTMRELAVLRAGSAAMSLEFTPDGDRLCIAALDHPVESWDLGGLVRTLPNVRPRRE